MKKLLVLAIISVIGLALMACDAADSTNPDNGAVSNTPAEAAPANETNTPTESSADTDQAEPSKSDLKPSDIKADEPVPAGDLNAAVTSDVDGWKGKEVSVIGKYHSTTTSKLKDGDEIRVDISDKSGKKSVSCFVKVKPSDEIAKERNGRIFKGAVKEMVFDRVSLNPCEFVK